MEALTEEFEGEAGELLELAEARRLDACAPKRAGLSGRGEALSTRRAPDSVIRPQPPSVGITGIASTGTVGLFSSSR